jgi:hypothetical protein
MAEIDMRLGVIGSKRRSTAKRRDGFVEPPLFPKRRAEIVVRLVVIGTQHQHAAVASLGLGCPAGLAQQIAELVMGLYEIGISVDCLAERSFRFTLASERAQHEAKAIAAVGPRRGERDRSLDMRQGSLRVAGAQRHDAEQMPCPGMTFVESKELPAGDFRLWQAPCRVLGIGAVE